MCDVIYRLAQGKTIAFLAKLEEEKSIGKFSQPKHTSSPFGDYNFWDDVRFSQGLVS